MIDSVNNHEVMFYKKLRETKYIKENKKYIVEGVHLVEEAYKAGMLKKVLKTSECNISYDVDEVLMSKKCLEKISLLKSVPDIMGVVTLKENNDIIGDKIIILDNVQDPGNVGTIIRSALAFNVSTVILSETSVNIFNDKLIRSSEGAIFKVNVITLKLEEALRKIKTRNIDIFYADMNAEESLDNVDAKKYALILGSEGKGISDLSKSLANRSVKIEMNKDLESLNVAVSASIIMYKLRG